MAHVLICFGWKTPITSITAYIIRPDSIATNQRYVKQCALCVSLSEHVPKILGTQRDAGTRLATALRKRPFSACNKGNRRRLHAGNFSADMSAPHFSPFNALLKPLTKLYRPRVL